MFNVFKRFIRILIKIDNKLYKEAIKKYYLFLIKNLFIYKKRYKKNKILKENLYIQILI